MTSGGIRVRGVWKRFGARNALAGVSLEAPPGACHALLGPNGSGKTTLVRILATLGTPTEGEVEVAGRRLPREAEAVRARVGAVLDHPLLPRDFTLAEGLRYYADLYGLARPEARIEALARRLGLEWRLRDPVRVFSRGMAQRAAIARALLHDPAVLLLDEPFTGLDPEGCRVAEDVVREACAAGKTVLLGTHDVDRAARLASTATLLVAGRVAFEGPPAEAAARLEAHAPRAEEAAGGAARA